MPTYEYACKACGEHVEVVQSFSDEPLATCPSCGGDLKKVFGSIGIVLKGSGFYRTDSRTAANGSRKEAPKDGSATEGTGSKDAGSDGATPASKAAPASSPSPPSTSGSEGAGA